MVNQFTEIAERVRHMYVDTSVVAFLKMDEDVDVWSLLYSSPQISEDEAGKEKRREIFKNLAEIIVDVLKDKVREIRRLGVFSHEDHLVADVLKYKPGTHIDEDTRMNGNIVHEAYIIISGDGLNEREALSEAK